MPKYRSIRKISILAVLTFTVICYFNHGECLVVAKNNERTNTQLLMFDNLKIPLDTLDIRDSSSLRNKDTVIYEYHQNGEIKSVTNYRAGRKIGLNELFLEDGTKIFSGIYCDGLQDSSDCNCISVDECLGDMYDILYANRWYNTGKPKTQFIPIEDGKYLFKTYDGKGKLKDSMVLEKKEIGRCYNIDRNTESGIYFLAPQ